MQTRHRTPVIFTLYMVDVFCCALGCVILLWLASARDAQRKAAAHEQTAKQLADARLRLASAQGELLAVRATSVAAEQDRDRVRKKWQAAQQERAGLKRLADEAGKRHAEARGELAKSRALAEHLRAELKQATDRVRELAQRDDKLENAARRLREAEQARAKLERQLEERGKDLTEARRAAAEVGEREKTLSGQLLAARADAERRFAGLALTGRRVVFLVDTSGSMRKRDPSTDDPKKWPLVCEALGRLMRSLPDLKQYQVIVFSEQFSYPLGRQGYWLDYDPKASAQATVDRLKRVVPRGDTNMSAAIAEAFRYRPQEMDTLYLLSDGLPNLGDGLPAKAAALKETEKSLHLSRYVRQTLQTWWNRPQPGRPRVRINTIGFYFDSPEVGAFLWALARENDGGFVGMSQP
jgi:hypothetical protein